jgi:hypothetical protein
MTLIAGALTIGLCAPAYADASTDLCFSLIRLAGLASLAQLSCKIPKFDEKVRTAMRDCAGNFSEAQQRTAFTQGFGVFDDLEKRLGHDDACQTVLKTYPSILSR